MASSWGTSWGTSWGNAWGDAGSTPVTPATSSGVGKRVIRLSEVSDRESTADYIKSFLKNHTAEPKNSKTVYRSGKQRNKDSIEQIAMQNMEIEAENEFRTEYNNQMILFLMAAYDE